MKTQQIISAIMLAQLNSSSARSLLRRQNNDTITDASLSDTRELNTRIIGGSVAPEDRYSYAVSLFDNIGHFCGGSLIAKDVILTAAHCQGGTYNIMIGRHDIENDNDGWIKGKKTELPHPNYDDESTDNDFMLVFLDSAITGNNFDLVKLNKDSSEPRVGDRVTVMGWGDTDIRESVSELSDEFKHVNVNVISNSECDESEGTVDGYYDNYFDQITSNMLCAIKEGGGEDSCQGDSGGPLVIKGDNANTSQDIQVGVVSWGVGCASQHFPGVYARVSRAYDWIEKEVCSRSNYAVDAGFDCNDGRFRGSNDSLLISP